MDKQDLDHLKGRFDQFDKVYEADKKLREEFRVGVHLRLNEVNNIFNKFRNTYDKKIDDVEERLNQETRRIDDSARRIDILNEHHADFKDVIAKNTDAINSLERVIRDDQQRRSFKKQLLVFSCKVLTSLVGLSATIFGTIAVFKELGWFI